MIYLFRLRKLIRIVLEEYDDVSNEDKKNSKRYFHFPKYQKIYKRFSIVRKNNKAKVFSYVLAIGESEGYIKVHEYPTNSSTVNIMPTIAVTKKGIKFMIPSVFLKALADSVGSILTLIIATGALTVSIIAIVK